MNISDANLFLRLNDIFYCDVVLGNVLENLLLVIV